MKIPLPELYSVNLHILSPIHVGAGHEIDPFSYVIKGKTLYLVDLIRWMETFHEKDALHRMMDSDNFSEIRTFIAENIVPEGVTLARVPVDSDGLLRTYKRVIEEKDPRNQLLIDGMTRNSVTQRPYIPGSSIKGAIRTAIANSFVTSAGVTSKNEKKRNKPVFEPDYNEKIFGKINSDPMRNLKISDVPLDSFGSLIVEAEEYSQDADKSQTPKGYKEVSASLCQTAQPVVYPLRFLLSPFELHGKKVDVPFIIDAMYRFYTPKYREEYTKFFSAESADRIRQKIAQMSLEITNLKSNETLIRIGHFSHVECVTLDNVRKPITRKGGDGRPLPWGTTRTLANGVYPFGWAKLEFLDIASEPRQKEDWPFSVKELESLSQERIQKAEKAKKAEQEAERSRIEGEAKRLAEEKRKAELEGMPPEERYIAELEGGGVSENRVIEIYNTIDEVSSENGVRLANALKMFWMKEKKWEKKDCSKKQKVKVQKVKNILGES